MFKSQPISLVSRKSRFVATSFIENKDFVFVCVTLNAYFRLDPTSDSHALTTCKYSTMILELALVIISESKTAYASI